MWTHKINQLELTNDIKSCHNRIQAVWTKKHLIGLGNANTSKAEVICFAEAHTDVDFRASYTQMINDLYQEGDIVLIEGLVAGEEIPEGKRIDK